MSKRRFSRDVAVRRATLLLAVTIASLVVAGCTEAAQPRTPDAGADALPEAAYHVDSGLPEWIDPETGYDTARDWSIEGGTWPIALIMSPSQSPHLLVGDREGIFEKGLSPHGITPVVERIELPPRTFHALQRSKWPFVYMPYAVFTDYCRTNENQGGAGGLQYVALAGSTRGGGYTLVTKDPAIRSVQDLAGKTVAGLEGNPARIVLLRSAAERAGLRLGDGPGEIRISNGPSADDLNGYLEGRFDAAVVLSILRSTILQSGSRAVTDFTDAGYDPSYTILCVERSVLEERPEVVEAFLEAHYAADKMVEKESPAALADLLRESWNGYFRSQDTTVAAQRLAPDAESFAALLGNMTPEDRLDPALILDCFEYLNETDGWGWNGSVDTGRLTAFGLYDAVLAAHGEPPQSQVSREE